MKQTYSEVIESHRIKTGDYATATGEQRGAFSVPTPWGSWLIILVGPASDWVVALPAWDHVSVSHDLRCPSWKEMCWVKEQFFGPEECVVQFHPPASNYVNLHPNCLHLWKLDGECFPMPPLECV